MTVVLRVRGGPALGRRCLQGDVTFSPLERRLSLILWEETGVDIATPTQLATPPNHIPPSQQVRNSVDSGKEKWHLFLGAWLCGMGAGRRQPVASSGSAGCASGGLG